VLLILAKETDLLWGFEVLLLGSQQLCSFTTGVVHREALKRKGRGGGKIPSILFDIHRAIFLFY
jgi:hypothetical protein